MATKTAMHRLKKELRNISREPPPHITARPLPSNILKWYFVLEGPSGTPYEGGVYMGKLHFPEQYPYKPPETWNPLWSVSAVLTGLLSFMLGSEDTVGSIQTSVSHKSKLARLSHQYNRNDRIFQELFSEFIRDVPQPVLSPASRALHVDQAAHSSARRARRRGEPEGESLSSLIFWLFLLVALILAIFTLIAGYS